MEELKKGLRGLGIELSVLQARQFQFYYEELGEWNKKFNLTSITDYREVQVKHFLDSLTVALALPDEGRNRPDLSLIDIGTGAGLPGLPLKLLLKQARLVLLDSSTKKSAFLRHLVQKLELDGVEIVTARAEEAGHLAAYRQQFELVVSRALAPLSTLVELALPFCQTGGIFVAQKKGEISQEILKASKATDVLGGRLSRVKRIQLEEFSDERYLLIFDKISPTPEKYPRRSGLPKRRPLQNSP